MTFDTLLESATETITTNFKKGIFFQNYEIRQQTVNCATEN